MRPFFSICIAAYNAERFIGECLSSIALQNCRDFEVVIVDDGSVEPLILDEGIRSLLPSCTLKRIANGGPYAARQMAFDIARGEVVLCVDADDRLLDPSMLAKIKRVFADNVDIVLFNASSSERNPSRIFDFSSLGKDGPVAEEAVWDLFNKGYSLNSLCCKAFKRTLYGKKGKPRPRLLMAEDRLQSLEVMEGAKSYWLIDEPLYYYRPNPSSTTHNEYEPAYYHQSCYVEEEVLRSLAERGASIDAWAHYFLGLTSNAVLGVRYNRSLGKEERICAYRSMAEERVFIAAAEHLNDAGVSMIDSFRISMLVNKHFAVLDAAMLPWAAGSRLKRLLLG